METKFSNNYVLNPAPTPGFSEPSASGFPQPEKKGTSLLPLPLFFPLPKGTICAGAVSWPVRLIRNMITAN